MRESFLNEKRLPLILEPEGRDATGQDPEAFLSLCLERRDFLREKLIGCGALLFRGFPALDVAGFARFVRSFSGKEPFDYVGGASPRTKLGGGVYTSTEYPQNVTLSLHNELSYTYRWPEHLYFCCVTPAARGGETPIADSRALLETIGAEVVRRFKEKGVKYDRNLPDGPGYEFSWQAAFETHERPAVERYCREGGIRFGWREDGGLWLSEVRPATTRHPMTGDEVWFNQADGFHPSALDPETYRTLISAMSEERFRLNSHFGDGSPLDVSDLKRVREAMIKEMVPVAWQAGDLLVLDNLLACHGRMPYVGPRKILLAIT